jgi:S-adenosylmethionine uptake transporter
MRYVYFVLVGFAGFSFSDAIAKALGSMYTGIEIVAVSSAVVILYCLVLGCQYSSLKDVKKLTSFNQHLIRSLMMLATTAINFTALPHVTLSVFYTIMFTSPFIVTLIARYYFKEEVGLKALIAVLVGFVGVVFGMSGTEMLLSDWWYVILIFISAFCFSIALLISRNISQTTHPLWFVIFPKFFSTIVLFPYLISFLLKAPTIIDISLVGIMSLCDLVAHVAVGIGFQRGSIGHLAPLHYSQFLWGIMLGWFIFSDLPSWQNILGGMIVIMCGLFVVPQKRNQY